MSRAGRGRRGTGTIRIRKDARFEGRYWFVGEGGAWKRASIIGADKAEVERKLRAAIVHRDATGSVPAATGKITTGAYLREWLASVEPTIRGRTVDSYRGIVKTHLLPRFDKVALGKLGPIHVQRMHSEMLAAGSSPKTVRNVHAVLYGALDRAVRFRLIPSNPAALVRPPRLARREMTALSLPDARKVLAAAETDPREPLWRLAIAGGLREGEIAALRWPDVDLDAGVVSVTAALEQRAGRAPRRAETKTARSRRVVPLDARTIASLREYRARAIEADLRVGKSYDLNAWVFRRTRGEGPLSMSIILKAWHRLAAHAGVPVVRFHDLRHTTATIMLAQGVDIRTIADVLGHADVATTLRTYAHATEGSTRRAAQVMGEALGS